MRRSQLSVRGALGTAALLLTLFVLPAGALALEPPRPGELDRYAKDGSLAQRQAFAQSLGNNRVSPAVMQRLKTQQFFSQVGASGAVYLPPPAWRGMPTTGNVKVLTLLIDFSDWPAQNTAGTESCTIGAATSSGDSSNNAKTFAAVTFTCADGGANAIQIEVQADCSIAAPTTLTIQTRPAQAKFNVVTPQT